jgi:hypothetical protein
MISIPTPSMVLNAYQSGTTGYNAPVLMQATNTHYVDRSSSTDAIANAVRSAIQSNQFGGRMKRLIFCCHGGPSYLGMGRGIGPGEIGAFALPELVGKIEEVWLRACLVARIQTPDGRGTNAPGLRPALTGVANGGAFCQALADALRTVVVASTELQSLGRESLRATTPRFGIPELPRHQMDDWDGLVIRFRPDHQEPEQHRYRSVVLDNPNDALRGWGN